MTDYIATIGLEVHVQLKTRSKMFCSCAVEYGAEPNTNVCPVCLGMPGALPVMNEEALKRGNMLLRIGMDCFKTSTPDDCTTNMPFRNE
jgi:Asp-tRNA(Asn)/Glu-tRNA(Gln) amidotransferase B subunit